MGSLEKMLILSVTGGVPKYLEEILKHENAEQNLIRLCFEPGGFLFNEFEKIFGEIFQARAKTMEKIVRLILDRKMSPVELSRTMGEAISSYFSDNIRTLELSGFIDRDYSFKPDGSVSRMSRLRLKDNYLRFYLKYIEPMKARILKGGKVVSSLRDLPNLEALMGLQFENLVLANRNIVIGLLGLKDSQIVTAAPYIQTRSTKTKGACQIDLLIHTTLDVFYLCEVKCCKRINSGIIREVEKKANAIKLPRRSALKKVLIYEGEIHESDRNRLESYFFQMISLSNMLGSSY